MTADREFVGEDWFDYLLCEPMTCFRIRVKRNTLLDDGQKQLLASVCFQYLQIGESMVLSKQRKILGNYFYVAALRLADGELLIVASSHNAETAIADYAKRWGSETLFGCFKTRGFCLESTHFQDSARIPKLFALLALALCWAFSSGLWLLHENPLKLKKHGRLPKSIFRIGFDFLRQILFDLSLYFSAFALSRFFVLYLGIKHSILRGIDIMIGNVKYSD